MISIGVRRRDENFHRARNSTGPAGMVKEIAEAGSKETLLCSWRVTSLNRRAEKKEARVKEAISRVSKRARSARRAAPGIASISPLSANLSMRSHYVVLYTRSPS